MLVVASCTVALLLVMISHLILFWANSKCNGQLPPASMAFPAIGETIHFSSPHSLYGHLFGTSLAGQKVAVPTHDHQTSMTYYGSEVGLCKGDEFANLDMVMVDRYEGMFLENPV